MQATLAPPNSKLYTELYQQSPCGNYGKEGTQGERGEHQIAKMVFRVLTTVKQLVGMMYPWIKSFLVIIAMVKDYKPKLYSLSFKKN